MDTARHTTAERVAIAALSGITSRHAGRSRHEGYDQAAAIAELHSVSRDPHLLAHAARGPREPLYEPTRALLIAAGATAEEVDAHAAFVDALQQRLGLPVGEGWQHAGEQHTLGDHRSTKGDS